MTRSKFTAGDIFSAPLDDLTQQCFQCVGSDSTQLNSDVIKVFKRKYPIDAVLNPSEVVKDEVEFWAHVVLKLGCKLKYWQKVGNAEVVEGLGPLFRNSRDWGNPNIKVSKNWYVWRINTPFVDVGELKDANRKAEIGIIFAPDRVVRRMRIGTFGIVYPGY